MPELPEVETVRRDLLRLVGDRVVSCDVRRRDVVRDLASSKPDPRTGKIDPDSLLIGSTVTGLRRHGKQLAIIARDARGRSRAIGIHLGMSGRVLITGAASEPREKHAHVVWTLASGSAPPGRSILSFCDPRRFGKVVLHASLESLGRDWAKLGHDAASISARSLGAALSTTGRPIKAALLDQHLAAGIGNIYADESLFAAGINPLTPADSLDAAGARALARCIRSVLRRAIDARGSTLRDYRDASNESGSAQRLHKVYGRAGRACLRCGSPIESARIAQRTSCWCPVCQPS